MESDGTLISSFSDMNDFYQKMYEFVDSIVEEDIDTPGYVGEEELNARVANYLRNPVENVFPNPTKREVTVDLKDNLENKINLGIYNVAGQRVREYILNEDTKIDMTGLVSGTYIFKFTSPNYKPQEERVLKLK